MGPPGRFIPAGGVTRPSPGAVPAAGTPFCSCIDGACDGVVGGGGGAFVVGGTLCGAVTGGMGEVVGAGFDGATGACLSGAAAGGVGGATVGGIGRGGVTTGGAKWGGAATGGGGGVGFGGATTGGAWCGGATTGGAKCGGAATGGPGFAGAPAGGPFGGAFGFPSGPVSPAGACATTIGEVCACEGGDVNCAAVSAVVASNTSRRFVMMDGSPEKSDSNITAIAQPRLDQSQSLGRIVAVAKPRPRFFSHRKMPSQAVFIGHSALFERQKSHCRIRHPLTFRARRRATRKANPQLQNQSARAAHSVLPDRAPAVRQAFVPAIPGAVAIHRDRASAAGFQAADCQEDFPAAARMAAPA